MGFNKRHLRFENIMSVYIQDYNVNDVYQYIMKSDCLINSTDTRTAIVLEYCANNQLKDLQELLNSHIYNK